MPYQRYFNIAIHSQNILPDYDMYSKYKEIDMETLTEIKYSEFRIKRLGKGYDTDCYSYESDTNYSYYRMRSDCVNDCYQDKMRRACKDNRGIFMSNSLIRKDFLLNEKQRMRKCNNPEINSLYIRFKKDC